MAKHTKKAALRILKKSKTFINGNRYDWIYTVDKEQNYNFEITEFSNKEKEVFHEELRTITESITTYVQKVDESKKLTEKEQKEIDLNNKKITQAIKNSIPVIDGKILGLEVEPIIKETQINKMVKVSTIKTVFERGKTFNHTTYVGLSSRLAQIYIKNYILKTKFK